MSRQTKYKIDLYYITEDTIRFGNQSRVMAKDDVDFMFKAISPACAMGWIESISSLPRFGEIVIKTIEQTEENIRLYKAYKVKRV